MEPTPFTLIVFVPVLMGLGLLCLVRRQRKRFEEEKKPMSTVSNARSVPVISATTLYERESGSV